MRGLPKTRSNCNLPTARAYVSKFIKGPTISDVTHERVEGGCLKHDAVREVA